jgi:alpha-tubulin suppressor-like RCC1 family protein
VRAGGANRLIAWGYNANGELGNGTTTDSDVPVKVKLPKGTTVTAASSGEDHSLALSSTGSVLAWGYNGDGQLGNGTTTDRHVPVKVKLPKGTKVTAISAGCEHSLALTSTGSVLAWGYNAFGQLGNGTTGGTSDVPVKVKLPKGTKVTAISGGCDHSLALTSTGSVLAWGYNGSGELGNGTTTDSDVPVKVKLPKGTKVTAISGGGSLGLALASSGAVWAWGYNGNGQLGNGTTTDSDVPVKVKLPKGTKATAVAAGASHSLALASTGSVLAWGYNFDGELGNGTTTQSDVPVKVKLPKGTKVTAVAAGGSHSLALASTGSVLAWGFNGDGELGNGTTTDSNVPVKVKLPKGTKATEIAAGGQHAVALTSRGAVLDWGYNGDGQLGNGTTTDSDVPVKVKLPKDTAATQVAAGGDSYHTLALIHRA